MYRRLLLSATTLLISLPLLYASLVPIKNINEEAYFGVWFQVYASATVKYTFELGGNCVTAEYNRTGVARKCLRMMVNAVGQRYNVRLQAF